MGAPDKWAHIYNCLHSCTQLFSSSCEMALVSLSYLFVTRAYFMLLVSTTFIFVFICFITLFCALCIMKGRRKFRAHIRLSHYRTLLVISSLKIAGGNVSMLFFKGRCFVLWRPASTLLLLKMSYDASMWIDYLRSKVSVVVDYYAGSWIGFLWNF